MSQHSAAKCNLERRANPARRSSRCIYPKTAARRLHRTRSAHQNQNPQNGQHRARFDWGLGAICFGASPVAAVFGSAPEDATPPKHRIHSNPCLPDLPLKQDISTLLGIGHFYFALTLTVLSTTGPGTLWLKRSTGLADKGSWRCSVKPVCAECQSGETRRTQE